LVKTTGGLRARVTTLGFKGKEEVRRKSRVTHAYKPDAIKITEGDKRMSRKLTFILLVVALALAIAVPVYALPGRPDFGEHVYADGEAWGTKATAVFKEPRGNSEEKSYDVLYIFTNGPEEQLLVGEAAPGNPDYNGGRWQSMGVTWNEAGMAAHDPLPVLKSEDEIMVHYALGHLDITDGSPDDHPDYFECPLLPVKE
jgi:hypothetical protein